MWRFMVCIYITRSDDMSSLCGPVVDDIRIVVSAGFRGLGLSVLRVRWVYCFGCVVYGLVEVGYYG